MGKDKKGINPADAFRREEKKKAIKKAQQQKKEVKEVRSLLNDPTKIDEEIAKYQKLSNESRLDKSLKDKIEELKQMKTIALRKQQIEVIQGKRPKSDLPSTNETNQTLPTSSSQHFPPSSSSTFPVSRRPEESVYYHPTFNPLGVPPPGAPMLYRPTQHLPAPSQPPMFPMAGIPRPVYGMAAPVGWNNGPRGIPPPPPRPAAGVMMGGVNGIPLPPPRPSNSQILPSHSGSVNPYLLAAQQRKEKKRRREEDDAVIDPLDPAADGYTERFQRNKQGKESHQEFHSQTQLHLPVNSEPSVSSSQSSHLYETDNQQNAAQLEPGMQGEEENMEEEESNDSDDKDVDENEGDEVVSGPVAASTVSNITNTTVDFSSFAKFTINKEEIMKRRLQTIAENETVAAFPAKPSEPEEEEEENMIAGPARPPATTQYLVEDVEDEEEDDNTGDTENLEKNEEDEMVGPSRPPTNYSSYENYYSMPYPLPQSTPNTTTRYFTAAEIEEEENNDEDITPPANNNNAKPLLPGFEYYDSDEEEEEVEEKEEPGGKEVISFIEHAPMIPSTETTHSERQREGTEPSSTAINSPVSLAGPVNPAKTLKKVKADSALRSLVPNVLKKKIQTSFSDRQQSASLNPEPRKSEITAPTNTTSSTTPTPTAKEDDLLGDFFNEIEGLGE